LKLEYKNNKLHPPIGRARPYKAQKRACAYKCAGLRANANQETQYPYCDKGDNACLQPCTKDFIKGLIFGIISKWPKDILEKIGVSKLSTPSKTPIFFVLLGDIIIFIFYPYLFFTIIF